MVERVDQHPAPRAVVSVLAAAELAEDRATSVANGSGTGWASNWIQSTSLDDDPTARLRGRDHRVEHRLPLREMLQHAARVHEVELVLTDRIARHVERAHFDHARARRLEAGVDVDRHDPARRTRPARPSTPTIDAGARADVTAVPTRA